MGKKNRGNYWPGPNYDFEIHVVWVSSRYRCLFRVDFIMFMVLNDNPTMNIGQFASLGTATFSPSFID